MTFPSSIKDLNRDSYKPDGDVARNVRNQNNLLNGVSFDYYEISEPSNKVDRITYEEKNVIVRIIDITYKSSGKNEVISARRVL